MSGDLSSGCWSSGAYLALKGAGHFVLEGAPEREDQALPQGLLPTVPPLPTWLSSHSLRAAWLSSFC